MLIYTSMFIDKIKYYFKVRDKLDTSINIARMCKDMACVEIDKEKVLSAYNISKLDLQEDKFVDKITNCVEKIINTDSENILDHCRQLEEIWINNCDKYFDILNNCLGIELNEDILLHTYCYLHYLPINKIDPENYIMCLDCNKSIKELFTTFIIMLTKAIIINKFNYFNGIEMDCVFDRKNKVWMFAEIAIDAIFANSDLKDFCQYPSYKYFYSLKLDGVNVMDEFRKLYTKISLEDFLNSVYMFVHKNYNILLKFKNYLY